MKQETKQKIKDRCDLDWDWFLNQFQEYRYEYLINEYIPNQGSNDMNAFINLGFNDTAYLLWKFNENNILKPSLSQALKDRIIEVFGKYPS